MDVFIRNCGVYAMMQLQKIIALAAFSALSLIFPAAISPVYAQTAPSEVSKAVDSAKAALAAYPLGGPELIKQLAKILSENPLAVDAILALAKTASAQQIASIGAAAQVAASALAASNPSASLQIQNAIVSASKDYPGLQTAYTAAAGPGGLTAALATGGGFGIGGGGFSGASLGALAGGGSQSNASTGTAITSTPTSTSSQKFSGSRTGGSSSTTTTSVSPTGG
jgi:hypothetical protein